MNGDVLIIAEEAVSYRELQKCLQKQMISVEYIKSVEAGMHLFVKKQFQMIIIDIDSVYGNIAELIKIFWMVHQVIIIAVSSKTDRENRIAVLEAGANVYFCKPLIVEECVAQVKSLLKISCQTNMYTHKQQPLVLGKEFIIDPFRHQTILHGKELRLTRREFELLYCLASHAGQTLSREQLYTFVWNEDILKNVDEVIKTHIKALRKKMTPYGAKYIKNVWGVGYQFVIESKNEP